MRCILDWFRMFLISIWQNYKYNLSISPFVLENAKKTEIEPILEWSLEGIGKSEN